jgi:hypothetical protein
MTVAGQSAEGAVYALKFVSGKFEGGVFPLKADREIVIGRQSDLDLVLVEDMVSRKHARLTLRGGEVTIQDLGSTNGTFVNGERVKKARLSEGDRILIGGSLMKLVLAEPGSGEKTDIQILEGLQAAEARQARQPAGMRGRIEDVPLPDLLQLLVSGKKAGLLSIRDSAHEASVFIQGGRVAQCLVDGRPELGSKKSFYRLLGWNRGEFEFTPSAGELIETQITEPLEVLLLEGLRQLDELRVLEPALPPRDARLAPPQPLTARLRDLAPDELDAFQLVLVGAEVGAILDRSATTDLETAQALKVLLEKGYLQRV